MNPLLVAFLVAPALGVSPRQDAVPPLPAQTAPAQSVPADYALDTDDTIQIEVDRHPYLNRSVRVPIDGALRLPRLLNPVPIRGLTCAQVAQKLTEVLQSEGKLRLKEGQVQVAVLAPRVRRLYVRGNAITGRDLDLKNGWRVTELVSLLGGVPQPDRIVVRLVNPARPAPLTLDLAAILRAPESPQNVLLQEGDTLTLDQPLRKRIFVKGEGPRGLHEIDERFGLRAMLTQLGFSVVNASGDLRHARLKRKSIAGDPNAPEIIQTVDLQSLLTDETQPEVTLQDLDTLEIPVTMDYVYVWGEIGGPRKYPLPQDRKTYLQDIMANANNTGPQASIGQIKIARLSPDGTYKLLGTYDWGKYLKDFKPERNPEILPQDYIVVPSIRRTDPNTLINQIVGGFQGLFFLRSVLRL